MTSTLASSALVPAGTSPVLSPVPTKLVLDDTMGALYIGVVLGMALWGVGSVQMYYYFNTYPKDDWRLKLLIVSAWLLDTLHQGFITHACYVYLITEYGNPTYLAHLEPTLEYMVLVSAFTCLLVQNFLVYRIWRLSRKNVPLVCVLEIIVVAEFAAVTAFFGRGIQLSSFTEVPSIEWIGKLINSLMVCADFAVTAALIYYLNRSRTGFKRSETMINRLIIFTIHTGLVTSVFATLSLIFSSLYPTALIYVTFFICVSKLYVNALFATLNSRTSMRGAGEETDKFQSISLPSFRSNPGQNNRVKEPSILAIKVDTETTHDVAHDPSQMYMADVDSLSYIYSPKQDSGAKSEEV